MLKVSDIAAKQLITRNIYGFAGLPFGKKREKVKTDLPKYDVVIAGGHLGAVLSNHFDAVVGEKSNIFIAYDTPYYQYHGLRNFYEQGRYIESYLQLHEIRNGWQHQDQHEQVRSAIRRARSRQVQSPKQ